MNLRSLLVFLDSDARCDARVHLAARFAAAHDSRLVGIAPTGLVELPQALAILLHCYRGYRIPEPTRLADQYVGAMRRAHGRGTGDA